MHLHPERHCPIQQKNFRTDYGSHRYLAPRGTYRLRKTRWIPYRRKNRRYQKACGVRSEYSTKKIWHPKETKRPYACKGCRAIGNETRGTKHLAQKRGTVETLSAQLSSYDQTGTHNRRPGWIRNYCRGSYSRSIAVPTKTIKPHLRFYC